MVDYKAKPNTVQLLFKVRCIVIMKTCKQGSVLMSK